MSGIANSTGAVSGVIGTTVGTPVVAAGTCHFLAYNTGTSWNNLSNNAILEFNGERYDPDGVFNTSNSLFTAPAAGVYLFGGHIYTSMNDTTHQFSFYVNGSRQGISQESGGGIAIYGNHDADDMITAFSQVITLTSGQTVGIYAVSASDQYEGESWWWGCRLK